MGFIVAWFSFAFSYCLWSLPFPGINRRLGEVVVMYRGAEAVAAASAHFPCW
jgi:hypothetical protein